MMIKIFVKPLRNAQHLKEKGVEQKHKKILQSITTQLNLVVKLERETELQYINNLSKIRNLFEINVDLIFPTNIATVILK